MILPDIAGVRAGEILLGKYRIERIIGIGGMGVVVAAHHLQLDERVAIKFLTGEGPNNPQSVARFVREARAAVKIRSQHVARVSDVGVLPTGVPYMVMEYLHGQDLSALVATRGPLPVEQAVELLLQACEAIAEAHALGIIHRDLKPANLFLTHLPDGTACVKVLDFGISKVTGAPASGQPQPALTSTSSMVGSPLYMSPEQLDSAKDADERSDIWALGVTLYELVAGVSPFRADTMAELLRQILMGPVPPLSGRTNVPPALEAVIQRCLEKQRGRRYGSLAELGAALLPFASRRGVVSIERISAVLGEGGTVRAPRAAPASPTPTLASDTRSAWGRTRDGTALKAGAWIAGASALLGAAGVAAWSLRTRILHHDPPRPGASSRVVEPAIQPPSNARPSATVQFVQAAQAPPSPAASASAEDAPAAATPSSRPKRRAPDAAARSSSGPPKPPEPSASSAVPAIERDPFEVRK